MNIIIPTEVFLGNIEPKNIYRFSSDQLNTPIPHYFVCVSKTETETVLMVVCTSQFEKRKRFVESREDIPMSTLVWIAPDANNSLTLDSFVDCNSSFEYAVTELGQWHEDNEIEYIGDISESHYHQILIGLEDSPLIEDEVKDIIGPLQDD